MPSGLPIAADVTKSLLSVDANGENFDQVRLLKEIYRLYKKHTSEQGISKFEEKLSAYGPSFKSRTATYEDVYVICSEMGFFSEGLAESPMIYPFMQKFSQSAGLGSGRNGIFEAGQKGGVLCDYIVSRLVSLIRKPYVAGFEAISEMAQNAMVHEISVFTLNHDILLEQFLSREGVTYEDGFGAPDGDLRWPDTSVYENRSNKVKLYKLHGGVDWFRFRKNGKIEIGIVSKENVSNLFDSSGARRHPIRDLPWFLTGKEKSSMYHYDIFNDLFFSFAKKLNESKTIVMSGYSWGDFTINSFIQGWLDSSVSNRLVLLHRKDSVDSLIDGSKVLSEGYRAWQKKGQMRVISNWLSEMSAAEILAEI